MIGRTNTGGGGGGLNFQVIGGTTTPSNPKENMIRINTSTKITDWVFSATQPNAVSGRVWISIGTSSAVEFNALKKNVIQVYPLSAKQYVNGAWENVDAMIYLNGKWMQFSSAWDGCLYNNGDQCIEHSGGWSATPNNSNYITFDADCMQFVNGDNTLSAVTVYTVNAIDITGFKNLVVKGTVSSFDDNHIKIGITNSNTTGYNPTFEASVTVSKIGSMNATLDLSGKSGGNYYIAIWSKYAVFKVTEIMLT